MNIAYFGSPEISAQLLERLLKNSEHQIVLVVTQKDKPTGKKQLIEASPVKKLAIKNKIRIFDERINNNVHKLCQLFVDLNIDISILFAYGQIIPSILLQSSKYGFLNVHPSLLPKYRGASPTIFPFVMGDKEMGITLMQMNEKLDEGPIINQVKNKSSIELNRVEFENTIANTSYFQIIDALEKIISNKLVTKAQDNTKATYTKLLSKNSGYIENSLIRKGLLGENIDSISEYPEIISWYIKHNNLLFYEIKSAAQIIVNMKRGLNPWPGVWTYCYNQKNEKKRLKILKCSSKDNVLFIDELQVEGKNRIKYKDFIKSYSI